MAKCEATCLAEWSLVMRPSWKTIAGTGKAKMAYNWQMRKVVQKWEGSTQSKKKEIAVIRQAFMRLAAFPVLTFSYLSHFSGPKLACVWCKTFSTVKESLRLGMIPWYISFLSLHVGDEHGLSPVIFVQYETLSRPDYMSNQLIQIMVPRDPLS